MPDAGIALELRAVEKAYGALRPLRVRDLQIQSGTRSTLIGLDLPAAETFINLATGAVLPDQGDVTTLGHPTSSIVDSAVWLKFVEQFGFVSERVALLDAMTVAQNLAIPFSLEIDPIEPDVLARVTVLASEAGIEAPEIDVRAGDASPLLRARVRLARALALDPQVILLEHPTATLQPADARAYGTRLGEIAQQRALTLVALSMDEGFGKALGGRMLVWQPATGEFKERRRWF
jgi:ABC-type transporter Mla maintaining outer membrane lipid asymmetry ATPase subunit MlaF